MPFLYILHSLDSRNILLRWKPLPKSAVPIPEPAHTQHCPRHCGYVNLPEKSGIVPTRNWFSKSDHTE